MKIRKNKQKYKQVSLQEMMAEITNNPMPKSNATRSIEGYIYVLGIIRRYGLNYIIDKVKDKFELSNFVLPLFEYGISFNDYLVTSSILSVCPNIRCDNNNFKKMYSGKFNRNQINCTAPSLSSGKIESLEVKIVPVKFCICRSDVSELGVQIT